jgi:KDO2-lipid IV(A) lauroyltransferase
MLVSRRVESRKRSRVRDFVEYLPAFLLLKFLGLLPRSWALRLGEGIGLLVGFAWGRLRRVGERNMELVFAQFDRQQRRALLRRVFRMLGRHLGEFSQFPKLHRGNIAGIVRYDGLPHYEQALAKGRGVLVLTAHFGAWELSSFAHALYGYPLHFLVRRLDNPFLDRLIEHYRTLSGNRPIDKTDAARQVLAALRRGEAVGVLMDVNTHPPEGVFCTFFGITCCTSPLVARFALKTGAPVIPGFLIRDEQTGNHILRFDPPVEMIRTGNFHQDLIVNTERLNRVIEAYVRRYPDHWVWVHKRWQTRPPGEPPLYP